MPPFRKRGQAQFDDEENEAGHNVSSCRIHVERLIQRLKYFESLQFFEQSFLPYADKLLLNVAHLVNHFPPLIKDKSES